MRAEVEDLRGAEVPTGEFQDVPLGPVAIPPVGEGEVLDLVGAMAAADGAEEVPAAIEPDHGRVLDGVARVSGAGRARREARSHAIGIAPRADHRLPVTFGLWYWVGRPDTPVAGVPTSPRITTRITSRLFICLSFRC